MRDCEISLNPNKLVQYLQKPACEFTKNDIIQFVEDNDIEMINFRYLAEDGRLKTLTFVITGREHLDSILSSGERVDGSSLFSFVEAGSSDLYVVPRYKTTFVNPFSERPAIDILCEFYTNEGQPLESSPGYILKKAHKAFKQKTGYTFRAMGELEYYLIMPKDYGNQYPARDQAGYHESGPFSNCQSFKDEAMRLIAMTGGKIKYGHSEVGNFTDDENIYEQQEIEFLPVEAEEAVDQLVIAKWVLRMLADDYGLLLSFAPKITVGKAGSGLHIHMMLEKDGKNMMIADGKLSDDARKMIAGILELAAPLTAFGNTIPTSYLRLVPHQEAPTNICWGDRNRSVLVRVPLGWLGEANKMAALENPQDKSLHSINEIKQTVELRSGDGSADLHHFVAGIIVAALHGLQSESSLELAKKLYMDVNIFDHEHKDKLKGLEGLPTSCYESAEALEKNRAAFEEDGIFPEGVIDRFIDDLKAYEDKDLSERLYGKEKEIAKLVLNYLHHM
ncbi:MAG: glutamine synthetase family protein [Salinivirgaceae bacterium]|nr:glutamine synthetase family protein [Salinivirgaceae bacterium]